MLNYCRFLRPVVCMMPVFVVPVAAVAQPFSDFDDGTLQGWTKVEPFNGDLYVEPIGGNPGGFLVASDTMAGGGLLVTKGPAAFSGDLRVYAGVSWDEFVYPHGPHNVYPSQPVLMGANGTRYIHEAPLGAINVWRSRYVSFDEGNWSLWIGGATFASVLEDATLAFQLEGAVTIGPEIGLDNIMLVPDCNGNGVPDADDIAAGTSEDCNGSGVPDECEDDTDGDGVIDDCDDCPGSVVTETIVIDGCDSGVANAMPGDDGCTMADAIAVCEGEATKHGDFVRCVRDLATGWKDGGLITARERGRIMGCAGRSDIP